MRTASPRLAPLFRSELQLELPALLLLQPQREWILDELAPTLAAPTSSVHRELTRAVDAGLLLRSDERRPHLYRAAPEAAAYEPMRRLLELTTGVPTRFVE